MFKILTDVSGEIGVISFVITVGTCIDPDVVSVTDFTISTESKKVAFPFTVSPFSVVREPYVRMSFDVGANVATGRELSPLIVSSLGPILI
jgi:hypothetical protein